MNCAKNALASLAASGSLRESLDLLTNVVSVDNAYTASCHGWAHSIGEAAAASGVYDYDFLLSVNWPNCTYGLHHGIQSFFLKDLQVLDDSLFFYNKVCFPLKDSDPDKYFSCMHLFGHFIADLAVSDPSLGLNACESVPSYSSCVDGLMMRFAEFIDLEQGGESTFVEQEFDASSFSSVKVWGADFPKSSSKVFSLCASLESSTKVACVLRSPAVVFRLAERDFPEASPSYRWGRVHEFCLQFDFTLQESCFKGIGIIALNMSGWQDDVLIEACQAGPGAVDCIKAVAQAFAFNNPKADPDDIFCSKVPASLLVPCRTGFASGL
jgi:hypothetical protein